LHEIRSFVRDLSESQGLPGPAIDDIVLAASEAAANAIVHTNSSSVEIRWRQSGDAIEVQIMDRGVFRRRVAMPEFDGHGRGIPLMTALVDELFIKEGTPRRPGTIVRLVKLMEPQAGGPSARAV